MNRMKKMKHSFFGALILISILISPAAPVWAVETTESSTETTEQAAKNRDKLLETANSFISSYRYNSQNNKFTAKYDQERNGWCTLFIAYVFDEAGLAPLFYNGQYEWDPQKVFPYHEAQGQLVSDPQPGDLVFVDWQGRGHITHAEIVEAVNEKTLTCISGNWGDMVTHVERPKGQVVGYIRPAY